MFTQPCTAEINQPKIIAVVHSYHKEFGWVEEVNKGISDYRKGAKYFDITPSENIKKDKIVTFYMNAKHHQGDEKYLTETGARIIRKINKIRPAITIICDDEALKYVTKPLLDDDRHRFVFLGVNDDPRRYGVVSNLERPEHNVTGLISEHPFYYTVKLCTKIIPDFEDIYVFFDKSPTGDGIRKNFLREFKKLDESIKTHLKKIIVSNEWEAWKRVINQNQNQKNIFIFGSLFTLRGINGKRLPTRDVAAWLSEHSIVVDITILTNTVTEGFLMAISNPGFVHGYEAFEKAAQIINGKQISEIPIEVPKRKAVHLNMERVKQLKLNVPVEIIAMSEYYKELGY
jgi:ABC-type uncharacterized transport system substrate-binding protein